MIDLSNTSVLVTGASRGIGAATARALDAAGARVVLTYSSSAEEAEAVARACTNDPVVLQSNLDVPGAGNELFTEAVEAGGSIDVVVNNAGIAPEATVEASDDIWDAVWQSTLQVNLISLADICRQAIIHFEERGGGSIINVSSRAANRGDDPHLMHYAASKGGVTALTRSIARGYGHMGIVAYTIAPGWVATDMATNFFAENPDALDSFPLGEAVPPEEVANTITFLASGAARHLTGSTLDINGATYVR